MHNKKTKTTLKKLSILLLVVLASLSASGCQKTQKDGNTITIVCENFPAYDFARAIVSSPNSLNPQSKETVKLELLIKPGMEIHTYDPSPKDIIKIQNADIFIYTGGESDVWLSKILKNTAQDNSSQTPVIIPMKKFVQLLENTPPKDSQPAEHAHDKEEQNPAETAMAENSGNTKTGEEETNITEIIHKGEIDEHYWTSPANAIKIIDGILPAILEADQKTNQGLNMIYYKNNAEKYKQEIIRIENQIHTVIEKTPEPYILVGDRFPYRYFAEEFGIEYSAAFSGCSSAVEASPATIARLINTGKEKKVRAVLTTELSNRKIAGTIAQALNVPVLELHSTSNLTQEDFDIGETYISLMERNLKVLEKLFIIEENE